jgi:hypothetical protein
VENEVERSGRKEGRTIRKNHVNILGFGDLVLVVSVNERGSSRGGSGRVEGSSERGVPRGSGRRRASRVGSTERRDGRSESRHVVRVICSGSKSEGRRKDLLSEIETHGRENGLHRSVH